MTLNNQERIISQTSSSAFKSSHWKWEKRHGLLIIALACLALWWFGSQITEISWIRSVINWLPVIGGMAFATEAIIKLV